MPRLRISPYSPALIMAPDSRAETWLGAAGWASGSQTCRGASPALAPKPSTASRNSAVMTPGPAARRAAPSRSASSAVTPELCQSRPKKAIRATAPKCAATR